MFDVGFWELLLIGGLALVILGPERLPKVANQLGRWVGRARAMARQLRTQLDQEVDLSERQQRWQGYHNTPPGPATPEPAQPSSTAEPPPQEPAPAAATPEDSTAADTSPAGTPARAQDG